MKFTDVWMQPWQLNLLSGMAVKSCNAGSVIEIGVYQGLSIIPIANAIYPNTVHAVDHWEGSSDWSQDLRERNNFDIFVNNIVESTKLNVKTNITIHRQDWREFAEHWTAPVGFLHLDAEHTKEEVSDQIETFLPYMAEGSIMAGDDYNFPGVYQGVNMHFNPRQIHVLRNKLWWAEF